MAGLSSVARRSWSIPRLPGSTRADKAGTANPVSIHGGTSATGSGHLWIRTLSGRRELAIVANVFAYDAEQLANRRGMRQGVILGHLVAHELGHLLLGSGSHSPSGVMHVPWHLKELDIIAQGLMVFMPQQAERMRTNIRAR